MKENKITIFTPTYNRAYIINDLYESLKRQTYKKFEWIVVDDGSTDGTGQLFKKWIATEKQFSIRYYKKENGGKHRAINYGLDLAEGGIFFVVDSDDQLTPDALEKINNWFKQISNEPNMKGIVANKGYTATVTANDYFSESHLDKTMLEMGSYTENGKNVLSGERAIAFYTDFHRLYKFPQFDGENFMTEAVVYNRMAHDGYKMRFFNDIIWIYEYQEDGLTKAGNQLFINNPHGYGLWLKEKADFTGATWMDKLKLYYTFTCELLNYHDKRTIAECIGTSTLVITLCSVVHKMIRFLKEKR